MNALLLGALLAAAPEPVVHRLDEGARRAYEELARARRSPPPRAVVHGRVAPLAPTTLARLERHVDGWVVVSVAVEPAQRARLLEQGIPERAPSDPGLDDAVVAGRLRRRLKLGRPLDDEGGRALFERLLGQEVRLVLGRDDQHRIVVLEARASRP